MVECTLGLAAISRITATFTGPRQTLLFPKAARPAAPCATYCYTATGFSLVVLPNPFGEVYPNLVIPAHTIIPAVYRKRIFVVTRVHESPTFIHV